MPISLVTGNINTWGNAGQFETDPSTWGFSGFTTTRSSEQAYSGLYSLRYEVFDFLGFFTTSLKVAMGNYPGVVGKTYLARARVRVSTASPFGHDDLQFFIYTFNTPVTLTTQRTKENAEDTWVEIESRWTHGSGGNEVWVGVTGDYTAGENVELGGVCYIDKFEIFEYIETEDPEDPEEPEEPVEEPTASTFHSKNPIVLEKTAPEGWESAENYRIFCDVRVEDVADSGVYNSKMKVELAPDTDGKVYFYLNEAFRDAFTFTLPTRTSDQMHRLKDRIKRFKCFTGPLTEIATVPSELTEESASLVLYGGVSKIHWPTINYLTTYMASKKKFLTWAPLHKYVDRLQEDYLNFYVYDETITVIKLFVKAYYDDGTNDSVIMTMQPVSYKQLWLIPAGPTNASVSIIQPTKNFTHYEISLLNQSDTLITEVRTYYIAQAHPLTRHVMFLNSLGAFETLRFTGQMEMTTEYVRDVSQRFLPHDYQGEDGEFVSSNNTMQPKQNWSSGFIKGRSAKEWHEYMQDFLLSPKIYDVTDGGRIPINIIAGSWASVDQNYSFFVRFDAKPAYDDQSFTPKTV